MGEAQVGEEEQTGGLLVKDGVLKKKKRVFSSSQIEALYLNETAAQHVEVIFSLKIPNMQLHYET